MFGILLWIKLNILLMEALGVTLKIIQVELVILHYYNNKLIKYSLKIHPTITYF